MITTSVIILTYNAPEYVRETIETINEVTNPVDREHMEIIVWDNASGDDTKKVLDELYEKKYVDKLHFSTDNLLFAGGNNACVKLADKDAKYYLLLNSDIRIVDKDWFSKLMMAKEEGNYAIASYGCCFAPPKRVDDYCYLINKELYDKYPLDEQFQWWWGITKQQALILGDGLNILGFHDHENMLIHWGGKSGVDLTKIKGNDTEMSVILGWFDDAPGRIVFKLCHGRNRIAYGARRVSRSIYGVISKLVRKLAR